MALRSGYKGFKKLLPGLKIIRPGTLGIDNDALIPELNKTFFPRSEQAVLGAKNMFNEVLVGWGFYGNDNDGYHLATAANGLIYIGKVKNNTNYIVSKGSAGDRFRIVGMTEHPTTTDKAGHEIILNNSLTSYEFNSGTYNYIIFVVNITDVYVLDNIKGMIRLASDPDDTYVPYAMTNKELTEKLTTKDVTVTAGSDVTVNANTHVFSKGGVVTGSLRLEIGATLSAGATIATLSAIPKNTTYAIGIDNTDKSVIPIIIDNNGAVQLFGGFIPTSGNQLLIPIAYATA